MCTCSYIVYSVTESRIVAGDFNTPRSHFLVDKNPVRSAGALGLWSRTGEITLLCDHIMMESLWDLWNYDRGIIWDHFLWWNYMGLYMEILWDYDGTIWEYIIISIVVYTKHYETIVLIYPILIMKDISWINMSSLYHDFINDGFPQIIRIFSRICCKFKTIHFGVPYLGKPDIRPGICWMIGRGEKQMVLPLRNSVISRILSMCSFY